LKLWTNITLNFNLFNNIIFLLLKDYKLPKKKIVRKKNSMNSNHVRKSYMEKYSIIKNIYLFISYFWIMGCMTRLRGDNASKLFIRKTIYITSGLTTCVGGGFI
jgi:hypothetical protein